MTERAINLFFRAKAESKDYNQCSQWEAAEIFTLPLVINGMDETDTENGQENHLLDNREVMRKISYLPLWNC